LSRIEQILQQNRDWAAERVLEDPAYFSRLAALQAPDLLWIGCSDSRVPANIITGLAPGEVFVHRNIANVVHPSDLNCLAVLHFSIDLLRVKHIIVCGHYGCGGVRHAMQARGDGPIDFWVQPIRDAADRHRCDLDHAGDPDARLDRVCELNVMAQVEQLSCLPLVREAWAREQKFQIHGWVYGLLDGRIKNLDCTIGLEPDGC